MEKVSHPGIELQRILKEKGISQSDFAVRIGIALPLLNNYIKGNRNFNINLALSLEAADIEKADYWMKKQIEYQLGNARNNAEDEQRKIWQKIGNLVPTPFFFKEEIIKNDIQNDIKKIFDIYNVKNIEALESLVNNFKFQHFRKSSAFQENRINTIGWSILAEYKASQLEGVKKFDIKNKNLIIQELNKCFLNNTKTLKKTKAILTKYGIKFLTLDRPPKTPVDGKSFMSGDNPAIVLTLKYKRLDNFAFTVLHELGHVFLHLHKEKYKNHSFFTNNADNKLEEFEANVFARNMLIDEKSWEKFRLNFEYRFTDDAIYSFSNKIKVHPAIIRGRVCFEYNEYYKKRSKINKTNKI